MLINTLVINKIILQEELRSKELINKFIYKIINKYNTFTYYTYLILGI